MKGIRDVVWDAAGQAPVIVQDASTGAVLALAKMDRAALAASLTTGRATYWMPEGSTGAGCAANGPLQMMTAVHLACDGRALLLEVQVAAPLCDTGAATCFAEDLSIAMAEHRGAGEAEEPLIIQWSHEAAEGA